MELAPRTTAPLHATGAVEFVPLDAVSSDATFRLREVGDVSALAASVARLGQLIPIELRPLPGAGDGPVRFQVVAGFRRLSAVRLLGRSRVLSRLHARLDDDDAWSLGLAQALLGEPLSTAELGALRARLVAGGQGRWAEEVIDERLSQALLAAEGGGAEEDAASDAAAEEASAGTPGAASGPAEGEGEGGGEGEAEQVTPEELAEQLSVRLWEVNQDLALAVDAWDELPAAARRMILDQAQYLADLHAYLSRGRR